MDRNRLVARVVLVVIAVHVAWVGGRLALRTATGAGDEPVAASNGDTNGDGARDISDAVYLLQWLFSGGPEPVAIAASPDLDARLLRLEAAVGHGGDPELLSAAVALERLRRSSRHTDSEVWNQPIRRFVPVSGAGFAPEGVRLRIAGATVGRTLGFQAIEELSSPVRIDAIVEVPGATLQPRQLLGSPLELTVDSPSGLLVFHGEVDRVSVSEVTDRSAVYHVTGFSKLHRLTRGRKSRIFQDQSDQDIVSHVLSEAQISGDFGALGDSRPVREYVVQYRESDFDFASRLLEEEGIYFTILDDDGESRVIFGDGLRGRTPPTGDPIPYVPAGSGRVGIIATLGRCASRVAGKATEGAYDELTATPSFATAGADGEGEDTEYRFAAADRSELSLRAERRLELLLQDRDMLEGTGNASSLRAGRVIAIDGLGAGEFSGEYFVIGVTHRGIATDWPEGGGSFHYSNQFTAIPAAAPYRPSRRTPRPQVHGAVTATVVGRPGETTTTDGLGRVKVRFPWDRESPASDEASLWIRVRQSASASYYALPEVGDEVLVAFLEGDPDRPYVLGKLYNSVDRPPRG